MQMPKRRSPSARVPLWAWVVGAGLLIRLLIVLAVPVFPLVANTWDSNFYHQTASHLASGEGYIFQGKATALFPPGFPAALAVAYRIAGPDPRAGQALNFLASIGVLAAAAWLAAETLGRVAARRTAMLLALDPSQIVMPAFLMSESVCALGLVAGLAALARGLGRGGVLWFPAAAAAGLLAGFARPHAFLLLPAAALAWGWVARRRWRPVWIALAFLLAVDAAALGLWTARNQRALGHPVPISTNGWMNLLLGNNPNARGGRSEPPGGLPDTGDEVRDEALAQARAVAYIQDHPGRVIALPPVKAARRVLPAPISPYRAELRAKLGPAPAVSVLALAQAFHLAAWGLALGFLLRRRPPVGILAAHADPLRGLVAVCLGVWVLGHLPYWGGARYFLPVEALLVLAAAGGWTALEAVRRARP